MAAKPSTVPVWNTGGTNNVEPTAGKKVAGWAPQERPPAQYFNYLQKLYGEWLEYLSDGNLELATSTVEGEMRFLESGAGSDYAAIKAPASIAASFALTLPDALPSRAARIAVTSAGVLAFETGYTEIVPLVEDSSSGNVFVGDGDIQGIFTGNHFIHIRGVVGRRIRAVRVKLTDENSPTTIEVSLRKAQNDPGGNGTLIGSAQTSAGNGTLQTLTVDLTGAPEAIVAATRYWIRFDPSGSALMSIHHIEIDWDYGA